MRGLARRITRRMDAARAQRRFLSSLGHLHGPKAASAATDGVVVVALVRDGMFHLEEFLRHYRALGAAQFVFCDNGSADGTVERLRQEGDCVILRSELPWGEVENLFRRHAAERYAPGRWCLFADMDEMFDPGESHPDLPALTRALDAGGYTGLVAQMLEMAPDVPLAEAAHWTYAEALARYVWYDLRDVTRLPYHDARIDFAWFMAQNTLGNPAIEVMFGGLRRRVFGENCCLTKHPLVKLTGGTLPGVHPHVSAHLHCAPFTALIRHYKFAGDAAARDSDTVARGVIRHGEDRARLVRLEAEPDLALWSGGMARLGGVAPLYEAGFLQRAPA